MFYVSPDNFKEVIIVGAGTCGLAVAARLCEDTPGSIYTDDEHQRFHWLKNRGNKVTTIKRKKGDASKTKKGKVNTRKENEKGDDDTQNKDVKSGGLKTSPIYTLPIKIMPDDILLIDAVSDTFLGQWDNQFRTCQIPVLRSPMFFHPDPESIDGMTVFAYLEKREKELMEITNVVGREYSKHQHKRSYRKQKRKSKLEEEKRNEDSDCDDSADESAAQKGVVKGNKKIHDKPGIIDINMRDWRDYYRPSTKLFRDFCESIVDRYHLNSCVTKDEVIDIRYGKIQVSDRNDEEDGFIITTKMGKEYACSTCVVASGHRGKINYPLPGLRDANALLDWLCHSTNLFNNDVTFPHPKLTSNSHVVVVGGGLTAAQLAHVLCMKNIKVTLIMRGPVRIKHFDFHLDWVTKYRNVKKAGFYILDTDEERLDLIGEARQGGLINPEYHKHLKKHVASGKLDLLTHTIIENGTIEDGRWNLTLSTNKEECLETGSHESLESESHLQCDYVYCATGVYADVQNMPMMRTMVQTHPIDFVGGYPCLTDDLQWNSEIPLYMVGKNAALRVGPTCANLDGARLCAERVGWKVQDDMTSSYAPSQDYSTNDFNWYSVLAVE